MASLDDMFAEDEEEAAKQAAAHFSFNKPQIEFKMMNDYYAGKVEVSDQQDLLKRCSERFHFDDPSSMAIIEAESDEDDFDFDSEDLIAKEKLRQEQEKLNQN